MSQEIMVFTDLVARAGNFEKDPKARTLVVAREGIKANFLSPVEAPDDPFEDAAVPAADLRDLPVGSVWKPRPGVSRVKSFDGEREWYVLIPADEDAKF